MKRAFVIVGVGIAIVLVVATRECARAKPDRPDGLGAHGPDRGSVGGSARASGDGDAGRLIRDDAGRSPTASSAELVVEVVERDAPVPFLAAWTFAADPIAAVAGLPRATRDVLDSPRQGPGEDGVFRESSEGSLAIPVPHGQWTRLRVRMTSMPFRVRFVSMEPFLGERRVRVDFGDTAHTLTVQAWRSGLEAPLANASLAVRWESLAGGEPRESNVITDSWGRATIADIEHGTILVRAPSARSSDRPPAVARVVASPYDAGSDLTCVVVEPLARVGVTLSMFVEDGVGDGAKLFFRGLDGPVAGALFPQALGLRVGTSSSECELPVGTYEVSLLPLDAGRVEPAQVSITANGPSVCRLHVTGVAPGARRPVRLEQIPRHAFPIQVGLQADVDLPGLDPNLLFVGPYRWSGPDAAIGIVGAARLVALSRQGVFLSKARLDSSGAGVVSVAMVPALLDDDRMDRRTGQVCIDGRRRRACAGARTGACDERAPHDGCR